MSTEKSLEDRARDIVRQLRTYFGGREDDFSTDAKATPHIVDMLREVDRLATECATEAARGEVERLRDDVLHARLLAAQRDDKLKAACAEADRLRERLAVGERLLLNAINVLDAEGDEGVGFSDWSELADKAIAEGRAFLVNLAAPVRPTFNHSREDSPLAPCKDCAALMDAPALREAIEDMRDRLAAAPVTPTTTGGEKS
jgi:hypothetical protein